MTIARELPALLLAMLAATPARADVADLAWLAGDWCGGEAGTRVEETWLPPRGGELIGVSRTVRGERVAGFEFLRIATVAGTPTYLAQPGGGAVTAFARTDGGAGWVRFENPAHDFPQRIEYRREGEQLRAEVSGPGEDGERQAYSFRFQRCPAD